MFDKELPPSAPIDSAPKESSETIPVDVHHVAVTDADTPTPAGVTEFCKLVAKILRRLPKIEVATASDEDEDPKTAIDEKDHGESRTREEH